METAEYYAKYMKDWRKDNPEKYVAYQLRYWGKRAVQLGLDPAKIVYEKVNKSNEDTEER